ncbi:hypothetical protein WISP_01656 [Willisornis vidua]|uniref:UBE2O N-terminal SH3-A domain-containing protein n=1 Tax=Willisornis vidua TaxID=1566151 RepID=A0ABQ9CUD3_9PASS|nr:hypothetical protein WISP_133994 [Willisornis vidua]KAJ7428157.1 hypothetical protein WISP_01656 [Willisornis vidua]
MADQPDEGAPAPAPPAPPAAPAVAPPTALPLSAAPGGSQRLLFSHDLVSGRYRGSVRFGLVRLIHGEDSEEDSEEGGRGPAAGGAASSGGSESGGPGGGGGEEGRASPLRRGYVRVQWYPEGIKQHVKETKLMVENGLKKSSIFKPGRVLAVRKCRVGTLQEVKRDSKILLGAVRKCCHGAEL